MLQEIETNVTSLKQKVSENKNRGLNQISQFSNRRSKMLKQQLITVITMKPKKF